MAGWARWFSAAWRASGWLPIFETLRVQSISASLTRRSQGHESAIGLRPGTPNFRLVSTQIALPASGAPPGMKMGENRGWTLMDTDIPDNFQRFLSICGSNFSRQIKPPRLHSALHPASNKVAARSVKCDDYLREDTLPRSGRAEAPVQKACQEVDRSPADWQWPARRDGFRRRGARAAGYRSLKPFGFSQSVLP